MSAAEVQLHDDAEYSVTVGTPEMDMPLFDRPPDARPEEGDPGDCVGTIPHPPYPPFAAKDFRLNGNNGFVTSVTTQT